MAPYTAIEAREIGVRDKWKCQDCGARFQDGYLLDASHDDDVHQLQYIDPATYHDIKNGKMRCLFCHIKQHARMNDWKSVNKTANRVWKNGIAHRLIYEKEPELLEKHRLELTQLLTNLGGEGKVHIVMK